MARFGIKVMPVVICFVLGFMLMPFAGSAYAQDSQEGYSLKIIEPADGATINTDIFHVKVAYTKPSSTWGINIQFQIKLVAPEDNAPVNQLWFDKGITFGSGARLEDSGTSTLPMNLDQFSDLGYAPVGEYELKADLLNDTFEGDIVATARSTFHYTTASVIPPAKQLVIEFTATPEKQKAGDPVTLSWKVNGADSVSIDQGIGSVQAEGNKEVTPTQASRSSVQLMAEAGVTEVVTYTATYTLKATDSSGKVAEKTVTIEIQPRTIDEIFKDYEEWGNQPHTWPDGTRDEKALVGPSWCGGSNNLIETVTFLTGIGSYEGVRWDCNAMQYRSLVGLNELKAKGKLIGWDYMPVEGAALAPTGVYPEHQAVAIWQTGYNWERKATILDPHDRQKPHRYSVLDGLDSIAPWHPDSDYGEVYPDIPDGPANQANKYQMDEFDKNTFNRWGNGQGRKTPWEGQQTVPEILKQKLEVPLEGLLKMAGVVVFCPVNILITNSAGQRLGKLSDGSMVAEFQPLDAYYWSDENGDKQWYYTLIDDTYKFDITGSGSGNFRLLTYTGGKSINDYGENPIATNQQAVLSVKPGTVGELTLADGSKVIPEAKTIESFQPVPVTEPAPTTEPTPAPTPTPEGEGFSLSFIGYIIGGLIVLLLIVFLLGRRKK